MRRLFSDAHFDFIGFRQRGYMLSAIALGVCLIAALFWQVSRGSWLNYGVDFTGGTLIQVRLQESSTVAELRSLVSQDFPGTEVVAFGDADDFLFRTPATGETTSGAEQGIPELLRQRFGADNVLIERTEAVGAKVGGELQTRALLAILLSFGATLVYVAFRFEWRFGLAAVIATAHDIMLTLGLISLLQLDVALPTVAAVLTIVGYSLNDTIVIFDRIRENLRGPARRHHHFIEVLNRSINDTLPRTVLTTGTTLVTLVALFLFGGVVLRQFALILIVGIVLGTYSSIFVASPALLEIEKRWPAERKKARVAKVKTA